MNKQNVAVLLLISSTVWIVMKIFGIINYVSMIVKPDVIDIFLLCSPIIIPIGLLLYASSLLNNKLY